MKFTFLEIEATTLLGIYLFGACIALAILYYIIKAAVTYGIIEAQQIQNKKTSFVNEKPKSIWTPAQIDLQKRYERGELTIEQYKMEWGKIK